MVKKVQVLHQDVIQMLDAESGQNRFLQPRGETNQGFELSLLGLPDHAVASEDRQIWCEGKYALLQ